MTEDEQTLRCSFCTKNQHDVKKLITGEAVTICDECVELCAYINEKRKGESVERRIREKGEGLEKAPDGAGGDAGKAVLYCSFCGKTNHEVENLIAGPTVFICNECIDLCTTLVKERQE